jgi:hypothetical protein
MSVGTSTARRVWPLLLLLFAVSGASGLVYEIVWMRRLALVFGSTTLAVSTVRGGVHGRPRPRQRPVRPRRRSAAGTRPRALREARNRDRAPRRRDPPSPPRCARSLSAARARVRVLSVPLFRRPVPSRRGGPRAADDADGRDPPAAYEIRRSFGIGDRTPCRRSLRRQHDRRGGRRRGGDLPSPAPAGPLGGGEARRRGQHRRGHRRLSPRPDRSAGARRPGLDCPRNARGRAAPPRCAGPPLGDGAFRLLGHGLRGRVVRGSWP